MVVDAADLQNVAETPGGTWFEGVIVMESRVMAQSSQERPLLKAQPHLQ